jgi:hypothetical protein
MSIVDAALKPATAPAPLIKEETKIDAAPPTADKEDDTP